MAKFSVYHQDSDRWWINKNEERVAYCDQNGDLWVNNFLVKGSKLGLPVLTTVERDALTSLTLGQIIYNSTVNKIQVLVDTAAPTWEQVTSA